MPTATAKKTVTFQSFGHNLEIIFRATQQLRTASNAVYRTLPGRRLVFEDHLLTVDADETDHRFWTGDTTEQTSEPVNIVEWLRGEIEGDTEVSDRLFGTPKGYWEVGAAPDEPKPTTSEQMKALTKATAARDIEAIQAVLASERETHNRDAVLAAGHSAIEALNEAPEAGADQETDEPDGPDSSTQ